MRSKEQQRLILGKAWNKLSETEREEFLQELSNEEISLLEDALWEEKSTKEAIAAVADELLSFRDPETNKIKKGKVLSIVGSSTLSAAIAVVFDLGIGGITGGVVSGAVFADIIESMKEEDGATRKIFRSTWKSMKNLFRKERNDAPIPQLDGQTC